MLHWSGETEGSDWRTSAEWTPSFRDSGEDKVLPHPEKSTAVTQRLLQIFKGHFTSVSWCRGRPGSTVLLMTTRNGLWDITKTAWKQYCSLVMCDLQKCIICIMIYRTIVWYGFILDSTVARGKNICFWGRCEEITDWEEESVSKLLCCYLWDS